MTSPKSNEIDYYYITIIFLQRKEYNDSPFSAVLVREGKMGVVLTCLLFLLFCWRSALSTFLFVRCSTSFFLPAVDSYSEFTHTALGLVHL